LAVSPEPEHRSREATSQGKHRRQVGKGLKRANGRGDAFDRVWSDFALPALGWSAQAVRAPAADVLETADEIVVEVDLPGHKQEELQIKVDGDVLTIEAERKAERVQKGDSYHRSERILGKFARSFTLPANVDSTRTAAKYEAGVLQIRLPKREEAKPRTIMVYVLCPVRGARRTPIPRRRAIAAAHDRTAIAPRSDDRDDPLQDVERVIQPADQLNGVGQPRRRR
jgi:HSP20 family protein